MAGSCYWGLGTRSNRIAWCLVLLFVIIGAAFWIPGVVEVKKCINNYNACRCTQTSSGVVCLNPATSSDRTQYDRCYTQYSQCLRRPSAVWGVGWFFLVIMSWIPCCYFCCCSKNPKHNTVSLMYGPGVQMAPVTAQPYNPYAGTTPAVGQNGGSYAAGYPHHQYGPPPTATFTSGAAGYTPYSQQPYPDNNSVPVHRY